jgi:sortase A
VKRICEGRGLLISKIRTDEFPSRPWSRLLRLDVVLFIVGLVLLATYACARVYSGGYARLALWAFDLEKRGVASNAESVSYESGGSPDFHLWSAKRIEAFKRSVAVKLTHPIGSLTIPRLGLTAPVFDGTDSLTLDRGLGRIDGTANIDADGNIGIAGHRDGFFRGLKDIVPGDSIEIATPSSTDFYVVDGTKIVSPEDVSVLRPTSSARLTLVTCYPFYFVGDAPKRFIVEASRTKRST